METLSPCLRTKVHRFIPLLTRPNIVQDREHIVYNVISTSFLFPTYNFFYIFHFYFRPASYLFRFIFVTISFPFHTHLNYFLYKSHTFYIYSISILHQFHFNFDVGNEYLCKVLPIFFVVNKIVSVSYCNISYQRLYDLN